VRFFIDKRGSAEEEMDKILFILDFLYPLLVIDILLSLQNYFEIVLLQLAFSSRQTYIEFSDMH
jgi:hypothetical protein